MFAVKQSRKIELNGCKLRVFKSKDERTLKLQKQAKFSGLRTEKVARKRFTKMHSKFNKSEGMLKRIKSNSRSKERYHDTKDTSYRY